MTSTYTANLALQEQGTGDNQNTWGAQLNANMITIIDQCFGSKLSLSVAGSANVTLTTAQSQYLYYNFTGVLTGNISVIYPANAGRLIIVNNATTGAFTLTVGPSGGTGFLVTQGSQQFVQIDPTANAAIAPQNDILPFEVTLASATTTDLGATGTNVVAISGTTTITSFGSSASINECLYFIRFTGALTLNYNATSLILPGRTSITTAAGDTAIVKYEGSGNWRCLMYTVAAGLGNSGTVNSGTANQLAYYATSTNAVNGTTALPSGTTATTQSAGDATTKVATDAFVSTAVTNGVTPSPTIYTAGSGTYSIPSGCVYLRVRMVGGGGGGSGSCDSSVNSGAGGAGGNTTFGSALLSAGGGSGSSGSGVGGGGAGGTASLGSATGIAIAGVSGSGGNQSNGSDYGMGGAGASSPFGGGGGCGSATQPGFAAKTNSGAGGGGAGTSASSQADGGGGGGAGGYVEAFIPSPSATYSYSVGAAGTAGTAGTNGYAGGAGGSGLIIIEAF